jgi:hypothetical protein
MQEKAVNDAKKFSEWPGSDQFPGNPLWDVPPLLRLQNSITGGCAV